MIRQTLKFRNALPADPCLVVTSMWIALLALGCSVKPSVDQASGHTESPHNQPASRAGSPDRQQMLVKDTVVASVSEAPSHRTEQARVFCLRDEATRAGDVRLDRQIAYSSKLGYGWLQRNVLAVELPEGNYIVSIAFDSPDAAASTTVKAESRRLMLMRQRRAGADVRRFAVNLRRPEINDDKSVRLNEREMNPLSAHWDNLLTLEFLPAVKGVRSVTIEPTTEVTTVYLAGDSTVTDQRSELWAGWGQCLPRFFDPTVAVANHAESGRALFSFQWENRLDKIMSTIRPGDYVFIQFGHNDQKDKREGAGPLTTYKENLESYISIARGKSANPVLVTPMERRRWSGGQPTETLTEFAKAVRLVGREQNVPVIDLHAMSLQFYASLGEQGSKKAFVHYPAATFPGQDQAFKGRHAPKHLRSLRTCSLCCRGNQRPRSEAGRTPA